MTFTSEVESALDVPTARTKIEFLPEWQSFFWMTHGRIVFKRDKNVNPFASPCDEETPLFASFDSMEEFMHETPYSDDPSATFISAVFLHDALYFAVTSDPWKVYKAYGRPGDLKIKLHVDLEMYERTFQDEFGHFGPIENIVSMDNYAYYTTSASGELFQWIPFVATDSDGLALKDKYGQPVEDFSKLEVNLMELESSEGRMNQRMHQQGGYLEKGRNLYHSIGAFSRAGKYMPSQHQNQLNQFTHKLGRIEFEPSLWHTDGSPRQFDFYAYDVQVMRHHIC